LKIIFNLSITASNQRKQIPSTIKCIIKPIINFMLQGFEPRPFRLEHFYLEKFRKISGKFPEIFWKFSKKIFFSEKFATLGRNNIEKKILYPFKIMKRDEVFM
jgi:hypothetical protein